MSALVMSKEGCWEYDENCNPTRITKSFAIGTGRVAAMAAMKAGATAKQAAQIATELDTLCGGEIMEMQPE